MTAPYSLPPFPLGPHPDFTWLISGPERVSWAQACARKGVLSGKAVWGPSHRFPDRRVLQWLVEEEPRARSGKYPYKTIALGTYPCPQSTDERWALRGALAEVARILRAEFGITLDHVETGFTHQDDGAACESAIDWHVFPVAAADGKQYHRPAEALRFAAWLLANGQPEATDRWHHRLETWGVGQAARTEVTPAGVHLILYGIWRMFRACGQPDLVFSERSATGEWTEVAGPNGSWPTWNLLGGGDYGTTEHVRCITRFLVDRNGGHSGCTFTTEWWQAEASQAFSPRRRLQGSFLGRKAVQAIKTAVWAHIVDKEVLRLAIGVYATGRPQISWGQYLHALQHRQALAQVTTTHRNRLPLFRLLPVRSWSSPDPFVLAAWTHRFAPQAGEEDPPRDTEARAWSLLGWPISTLQVAADFAKNDGKKKGRLREMACFNKCDWPALPVFARLEVLKVWTRWAEEESHHKGNAWSLEDLARWLSALARCWCDASCGERGPTRSTRADLARGLGGIHSLFGHAEHLSPAEAWRHLSLSHPWRALLQAHCEHAHLRRALPANASKPAFPLRPRRL